MEHHAYYYEGSQSELGQLAESASAVFSVPKNSPDFHCISFEKFGIDDAHELMREAKLKSVSGRALFVIGISITNTFAQQALLKLLEEPQLGVTFVLLVPPGSLMPTIKSRLLRYEERQKFEGQKSQKLAAQKSMGLPSRSLRVAGQTFAPQVLDFLKSSNKERSAQVTALLKDDEGVRERVRDFINGLEMALHKKTDDKGRAGLEEIVKVRSYLSDQSPSLKMLLEHLALALPKV